MLWQVGSFRQPLAVQDLDCAELSQAWPSWADTPELLNLERSSVPREEENGGAEQPQQQGIAHANRFVMETRMEPYGWRARTALPKAWRGGHTLWSPMIALAPKCIKSHQR